jgi:putative copper export protein/mono/diheme cytochrome c family protein
LTDLLIAARAVHFAGTALTAGLLFFLLYAGGATVSNPANAAPVMLLLRARVLRLAWAALVAAVISGALWVLGQAAEIGDTALGEAVSNGVAWTVLTATHFGTIADIRLGLALGLGVSLILSRRSQAALWIASAFAAALLATIAWAGHAAGTPGPEGVVHLSADALHLLAAGAWVGGLLPLSLLLGTAYSKGDPACYQAAQTAILRFSMIGIASVGTLLATGSVNTWILAGSMPALIGTDYGHLLLMKITLFLAMVSVAAINRFRLTPLLSSQSSPTRRSGLRGLARNALIEFTLGLAIFAAVGALGMLPPGLHMQPVWPLRYRLNLDLLAYPDLGARGLIAILAIIVGVGLISFGLLKPVRRWTVATGAAVLILGLVEGLGASLERAYPTSFYASPTGYSTDSIAQGRQLFVDNCAICHGRTGRGDGPAAAQAERKPADLTAEHIYAHPDGDLFWWITSGIESAMPAFGNALDETAVWNVIDFIHANADGAQLRSAVGETGATGFPMPGFTASCGGMTVSIESLRGRVVHLMFVPGETVEPLKRTVERDRVLGLIPIIASSKIVPGLDGDTCVADDPSLLDTIGTYRGVDTSRIARTEWLADAAGFLRSMWYPESPSRNDWGNDEAFGKVARELQLRPAVPKRATGHAHH